MSHVTSIDFLTLQIFISKKFTARDQFFYLEKRMVYSLLPWFVFLSGAIHVDISYYFIFLSRDIFFSVNVLLTKNVPIFVILCRDRQTTIVKNSEALTKTFTSNKFDH